LYHQIVPIFFSRTSARDFFRFEAWDRSLMPAPSKYKHLQIKFCSLMLNFSHHTLWHNFYFLKYFQIFSRTVEAAMQTTRTNDAGEMDIGESRGCIATSYLPLSDIAKLQLPEDFFRNS